MSTADEAKALHEAHSKSLLFTPGNLSNLPCADFQLDTVVVDLSRFPRDFVGPVVTDELGIYENSFVGPLEMAPEVPVCEDCEIRTIGMWCKWKQNPRQQCQACVEDDYRSVLLPPISTKSDTNPAWKSSACVIGGVQT